MNKYTFRGIIFIISFVLFFPVSCHSQKKFCKIFLPDGISLTAELAVTPQEKERGLMFRESINWDQAMLFVFKNEEKRSFWMKNMNFSIDILWLDREKRIVHIHREVPVCRREPCPSYASPLPVLYVLELKAGAVDKYGLEIFERIDFIINKKRTK